MIRSLLNKFRYSSFGSAFIFLFAFPVYRISKALVNQVVRKVKVNGRSIVYDSIPLKFPKNVGVGFSSNIFWKGEMGFEPYTWKTIKAVGGKVDLFLDVGSHFGFYSVLVQRINPSAHTVCYEPIPGLFQDNQQFHQVNQANRSTILQLAVSQQEGTIPIYVPTHESINEVRSASLEQDFFYNRSFKKKELTVQVTTLNAELIKNPEWVNKKILLKIDVEGHEGKVLQGAIDFIKRCKPVIVCEIDNEPEPLKVVMDVLRQVEYSAYAIGHEGLFKIDLNDISDYTGGRDFLLIESGKSVPGYMSFEQISKRINL